MGLSLGCMISDDNQKFIKRNGHEIYVQRHGPFSDRAIIFLHGGPGIGFSEKDKNFFNFKEQQVILFDQRGSGRSKPSGHLENNTSLDLLEDIDAILDLYEIKKAYLFGGSWGSTLALLYAIHRPEMVDSIFLRGLFCASMEERSFFEEGGTEKLYPEAWQRLRSLANGADNKDVMSFFFEKILLGTENERKKYSFALERYGLETSGQNLSSEEISEKPEGMDPVSASRIFAHYSKNKFFIEDQFIWDNLKKVQMIPMFLVHGKRDHITTIEFAHRFEKFSKNFKLLETEGGHSGHDAENFEAMQMLLQKHTQWK